MNHLLISGAPGALLWKDETDRRILRSLVEGSSGRAGVAISGLAFARNSYHLVLSATPRAQSRLLHDVHRRYSRHWKKRHGARERVFSGSTAAFSLEEPFWKDRTMAALKTAAGLSVCDTPMDVWTLQLGWLLELAEARLKGLKGEAPKTIAVGWAGRAGIPPRAIARRFGYADGHSASVMLDALRRRAKADPDLKKILGGGPRA